jgi:crotonobetainyl-CoA:carnitine CoA-transferase CaiB-like acyl-CoA transferase
MMGGALQDVRILDLSRFISGPYCTQILADMGAEVIRIEKVGGGDDRFLGPFAPNGESMGVMVYSRNKRGITLNIRTEEGRDLFRRLVKVSDVVLENFTAGYLESLEIGYEDLSKVNPGIIFASITAYGRYGPYAAKGGFDQIVQGMSGMMYVTGHPGDPPTKAGVSLNDYGAAIYNALGIVLALRHRDKTGEGQQIDVSLFDTAISFMETIIPEYKVNHRVRPQIGNRRPYTAPTDTYRAKDGYVSISISTEGLWRRFTKLIGREDLTNDPRFTGNANRAVNQQYLNNLAAAWVADKTVEEVLRLLDEAHIPCGTVQTITEVVEDPQVKAREMIVDIEHPGAGSVPLPGIVIKMSKTPGEIRSPAPLAGQHNEEVYRELLGLSQEEIEELRHRGVI